MSLLYQMREGKICESQKIDFKYALLIVVAGITEGTEKTSLSRYKKIRKRSISLMQLAVLYTKNWKSKQPWKESYREILKGLLYAGYA